MDKTKEEFLNDSISDVSMDVETDESLSSEPNDLSVDSRNETKKKLFALPIGRVKTIMKSDPEVKLVNSESVVLVTKATELFIKLLAIETHKKTIENNKKILQRKDLDEVIKTNKDYAFLDGAIDWDV